MKRVFLLMFVSALLVTLGFAQTPSAGSNTDQANVKGCLGGSDGNYTVAEDGTRQIFKITTSSVDLKPHLGHDVKLTGHKASGAVSSGAADNSFAVTELNMISEHCAAAAAAPAATVSPLFGSLSVTPAADAAAPAATVSPSSATASTPAADAAAPLRCDGQSVYRDCQHARCEPRRTCCTAARDPVYRDRHHPAAAPAAPAATVSPSAAPVSTPRCGLCCTRGDGQSVCGDLSPHPLRMLRHLRRRSVRLRRLSAHPLRTLLTQRDRQPILADSSNPDCSRYCTRCDGHPVLGDCQSHCCGPAAPAQAASPASATVSTPTAAATTPTVTHKSGSLRS